MRRLTLAVLLVLAMVIPLPASATGHCAQLEGRATYDNLYGGGSGRVVLDGQRMNVSISALGFGEIGTSMYYDFYFPGGTVFVSDFPTVTPTGGPFAHFSSTVEILSGGEGTWQWSGTIDYAHQTMRIERWSGTLCFD